MKFKQILFLVLAAAIIVSAFTIPFKNNKIPWERGILNGEISIHVRNGFKYPGYRLEGYYQENQRMADWKLFDKDGNLLQSRTYINNFNYETDAFQQKPIRRNESGYFEYPELSEKDIAYALRVHLVINEHLLNEHPELAVGLQDLNLKGLTAYKSSDLKNKMRQKEIPEYDFSQMNEIRLMGDFFYDKRRRVMAFLILGFSPVSRETNSPSAWYYFPDMRDRLSRIPITIEHPDIKSLDDYFFLMAYPYLIYKVEGGKEIPDSDNLQQELTYSTLEDLWMKEVSFWLDEK